MKSAPPQFSPYPKDGDVFIDVFTGILYVYKVDKWEEEFAVDCQSIDLHFAPVAFEDRVAYYDHIYTPHAR